MKHYRLFNAALTVLALSLLIFLLDSNQDTAAQTPSEAGGIVFADYNYDGIRFVEFLYTEPGVNGIIVRAYDSSENLVGCDQSGPLDCDGNPDGDAPGAFHLAGVSAGAALRFEFTIPPPLSDYLVPGRHAHPGINGMGTNVIFSNGDASDIRIAVVNPADYCHTLSPNLVTTCYNFGYQGASDVSVLEFEFSAQGDDPHFPLASGQDIGASYGLAYHGRTDTLFISSHFRRHSGLRADDPATSACDPGDLSELYILHRPSGSITRINVPGIGPSPRDNSGICSLLWDYLWDGQQSTWDAPGKVGIGDIEISEDERTLYVMNLSERSVYVYDLGDPQPNTPPTPVLSEVIPVSTSDCTSAVDARPFGLGYNEGHLYVGLVCTAESTQNQADLRAIVYEDGAIVLNEAINFDRGCADGAYNPGCNNPAVPLEYRPASWQPWSPTFTGYFANTPMDFFTYPEPLLSDIEFDDGDMILGFRDRYGDQVGHYAFSNPNDPTRLVSAAAAGDILRACRIGDAFVLEDLGLCRFQGSGVTNNQGPGGGEYYNGDDYSNNAIAGTLHHQIASGALVQVPGRLEVASTVMDPLERHEWAPLPGAEDTVFDAGVRWFDNEIGDYWRSYRIYNGQGTVTDTFGKANGLGDLEAICGPAPLEIGNYVWLDEDRNGIQSPDWSLEPPIAGVWVSLYIFDEDTAERSLVAQTQTDSSGHYYFNELTISAWLTANGISDPDPANYWWDIDGDGVSRFGGDSAEPFGVMPFRTYEVRIDDPRNFDGSSASLFELYATFPTLSEAQRDSDGVAVLPEAFVSVSNFVSSGSFVTGDFGANNHNVDFGFTMTALDEPTEPPTPDQTEEPTEPPTPDQTEEPTEPPTPDQTDEPTQPPTDEPTQPPTDEPTQPPAPPTEPPAPPTEPPAPPIEPPACARHNTERLDCSTIAVTGRCEGNVAVFTIRNGGEPGEGDMVQPTQWRLTDESTGALLQSGQVWLAGGTSMEIRWDGGGTVRLNADQQIGHPGNSRPNQVLSCGSGGGQQGNGNGRGNSQRP